MNDGIMLQEWPYCQHNIKIV